ncbi:hypothetical protein JOL62DRAFT_280754 [Phyllosticta paracitricarpa]|uniref:Uncharacterized protein n=1 Tax=Phyllosticta paracitricarpa TaxID=2016321 RepID=A0ABR1MW80_9PEZI
MVDGVSGIWVVCMDKLCLREGEVWPHRSSFYKAFGLTASRESQNAVETDIFKRESNVARPRPKPQQLHRTFTKAIPRRAARSSSPAPRNQSYLNTCRAKLPRPLARTHALDRSHANLHTCLPKAGGGHIIHHARRTTTRRPKPRSRIPHIQPYLPASTAHNPPIPLIPPPPAARCLRPSVRPSVYPISQATSTTQSRTHARPLDQ